MSEKFPIVRVDLIRNAQPVCKQRTDGEVFRGQGNTLPLSFRGDLEANRQAFAIKGLYRKTYDAMYSSPAAQCLQTARHFRVAMGFRRQATVSALLDDIDYGDWRGKLMSEVLTPEVKERKERSPETYRPPNGESPIDVNHRISQYLGQVLLDVPDNAEIWHVAAFTHNEPIVIKVGRTLPWPIDKILSYEVPHASITSAAYEGGVWNIDEQRIGVLPNDLLRA